MSGFSDAFGDEIGYMRNHSILSHLNPPPLPKWYEGEPAFVPDADPEATVIPTHEVALAYLRGMRATLWPSQGFTISGNEGVTGIEQAAEFITKVVEDIASIRNVAMGSTRSLDDIVVEIRNRREGY